jgi:beta-glucanase (GH16 family)
MKILLFINSLLLMLSCSSEVSSNDGDSIPVNRKSLQTVRVSANDDINPEDGQWDLVWNEEFDYSSREDLLKVWEAQNGPNPHILCSRWEENIEVGDGVVKLVNKKESRGGQDWTSGSMWTRQQYQYGYYECRYKYAAVNATNNSFWLMTRGIEPTEGKKFEIDILE